MLSFSTILAIFFFNTLSSAFTTFDTNCTLPADHERVSYVSSPNTRGTLNIIWSCLFTIIACTWTVQHPDVPWQRKHYENNNRGWWKWKLRNVRHSVAWFLGTIIAPEVPLAKYLGDLLEAREFARRINNGKSEEGTVWTQTHCLFAVMDGFVLRTNARKQKVLQTETAGASSSTPEKAQSECTDSAPNDDTVSPEANNDRTPEATTSEEEDYPRLLTPDEILKLLEKNVLKQLPDIDLADIENKSKSDDLMRLIAVVQLLWLCIQVIARAVADLAVSQLEIATVAFSLCAVIMYGLAWNKPKGVQTPITIFQVSDNGRKKELGYILDQERTPRGKPDSYKWIESLGDYFKVDKDLTDGSLIMGMSGAAIFAGTLFGGVHVAAWNSVFPTHTELLLWRVAALYCTCFPLGIFLLAVLFGESSDYEKKFEERIGIDLEANALKRFGYRILGNVYILLLLLSFLSVLVYILARLYILVEMFRTLAFQPTGAFVGTWAVNLPNVN